MIKPKSKFKTFLNHPWTIGLGCVLFAIVVPIIFDIIKKLPFLTTLSNIFFAAYNIIGTFFTIKTPMYIVVIIIILVIIVEAIYFNHLIKKYVEKLTPKLPAEDFIQWNRDKFKKIIWTWKWIYNAQYNKYLIADLRPECNKCSFKMYNDNGYAIYICPNCGNIYGSDVFENPSDIRMVIEQRVEKGDYPKNDSK